jgi:hypothetical protein
MCMLVRAHICDCALCVTRATSFGGCRHLPGSFGCRLQQACTGVIAISGRMLCDVRGLFPGLAGCSSASSFVWWLEDEWWPGGCGVQWPVSLYNWSFGFGVRIIRVRGRELCLYY